MSLQQFFTRQHWWGKILGFFFGFLIGRAVGALIGVLIGNFFDQGLSKHFSRKHWYYHQEKRKHIQTIFFTTTFSVMGHVAKADGRVSEEEIAIAKKMMREMGLSPQQKETAKYYFTEGKKKNFDLQGVLSKLFQACHDNPELIRLFIDIQYQAASIEPLTTAKINALNIVLTEFGFAPLHAQNRFYDDFAEGDFRTHTNHSSQHSHHKKNQHQQRNQQKNNAASSHLAAAYAILMVSADSSKQEVKKAYRRLVSKNHPDKLIAQGFPEEMIKLANKKTQQITKAYEQICTSKGW